MFLIINYFTRINIIIIIDKFLKGVGKTTLLKKLYEKLSLDTSKNLKGFYTEEIRDNSNSRIGFDVIDFKDNKRAPLARLSSDVNISIPKVGKYSIDLISFEKTALPILKVSSWAI